VYLLGQLGRLAATPEDPGALPETLHRFLAVEVRSAARCLRWMSQRAHPRMQLLNNVTGIRGLPARSVVQKGVDQVRRRAGVSCARVS
jgi:hypothetical protein